MITNHYYMKTLQKHAVYKVHKTSGKCYKHESKTYSKNIKLDNHVESLTQTPALIALKDHKENFSTSYQCHLINPSKNELVNVNKVILENVHKNLA